MIDQLAPSSPGTHGRIPHPSLPSASARMRCTCQSSRASGGVSRNDTRSLRCTISGVILHALPTSEPNPDARAADEILESPPVERFPAESGLLGPGPMGPACGVRAAIGLGGTEDPGVDGAAGRSSPS